MFEKTKILIEKFKKENLVINNYQSQLERITNGKMAILKTVVYNDANKEKISTNTKLKTDTKKKYVKSK